MDDKKPSTLEGIRRRSTDPVPNVESRDAFQEARTRSRDSIMLDVRLANGDIESFNYAYLTRLSFHPGDAMRLQFGGYVVRVEGKRLKRLREALSEHRARFIQEGTEAEEGLKPEDAAHIDSIVIEEKKEET